MPRKRKRKFSLLSAIFLELASLAGIISVVQPTMVLSWFGVELHSPATTTESARSRATASPFPQAEVDRPLTDFRSYQSVESTPFQDQGRAGALLTQTPSSGWAGANRATGPSQVHGPNQLNPILPKPEGEAFPRLATRQLLSPPGHRPTWDYSYPPQQIFP